MANRDDFSKFTINLQNAVRSYAKFDVGAFIVDSPEVPLYSRFRVLVPESVEDLDESGIPYKAAKAFFRQRSTPDRYVLIRQVKTETPPAFVCGIHDKVVANFQAVTTGELVFVDGDLNTDTVSGIDLSGITAIDQIPAVLNAELAGIGAPNITGLDTAEFEINVNDRFVITMPAGQGAADPNITITFNATPGTLAYLLGLNSADDGIVQPGHAVEDWLDAYNAAKILTDFYLVDIEDRLDGSGTEIPDAMELASQIAADKKQCTFVDSDAANITPADVTSLHSMLKIVGTEGAIVIYSEHSDEFPDSACDGYLMAKEPGETSYGGRPLNELLKASGSTNSNYDLIPTDLTTLKDKKINHIRRVDGETFIDRGYCTSGNERRMVLLKHWMENGMSVDWFAYKMDEDLVLYDRRTLAKLDEVIRKWLDLTMGRYGIYEYDITLPTPAEFAEFDKTDGEVVITKAFSARGIREAHVFEIEGDIVL